MDYNKVNFKNKDIKNLSKRQLFIAKQSGNPKKIESSDFKKLRKRG
jgi:accessory colonization factor AcfC